MLVLNNAWKDNHLDFAVQNPNEVRINVHVWMLVSPVAAQYITYTRDWRIVWNYLWEVGPRTVIHKIMSRTGERRRNAKYVAVGLGQVNELATGNYTFKAGDWVTFFAYNHPKCVDR